jgi:hypothetical protein
MIMNGAFGNTTFGTTAGQLSDAAEFPCRKVKIKAAPGNSGDLYVGLAGSVTSLNGWTLDAGQEIEIEVEKLGDVWVIGGAASQVAEWIATPRPVTE